jgi:predicted O-methyltransferase YrrM
VEGLIPGIPAFDASDDVWNIGVERWRHEYVEIKYRVAMDHQPKRICEIGVYSGIAALSFLAACPSAEYVGIDNLHAEYTQGLIIVERTKELLVSLGYRATVLVADSQQLDSLPGPFDLVHVDGDHSRTAARHDTMLAWWALQPKGCLLVDNGHDMSVAAGVFDAMHEVSMGQLVNWRYLPDSVGNILIYKERL